MHVCNLSICFTTFLQLHNYHIQHTFKQDILEIIYYFSQAFLTYIQTAIVKSVHIHDDRKIIM